MDQEVYFLHLVKNFSLLLLEDRYQRRRSLLANVFLNSLSTFERFSVTTLPKSQIPKLEKFPSNFRKVKVKVALLIWVWYLQLC